VGEREKDRDIERKITHLSPSCLQVLQFITSICALNRLYKLKIILMIDLSRDLNCP